MSIFTALAFANDFFCTVLHGAIPEYVRLDVERELSIQESEEIIEHIVEKLGQGADITHPALLSYWKPLPDPKAWLLGCVRRLAAAARRILVRSRER